MKFTEFNLNDKLLSSINDAGFEKCTECQEITLQNTLNGKDVCVQSQTGTGKTAAFLITIFELFEKKIQEGKAPTALIVVPTRELALQIEDEASVLGKYQNFKTACFVGGVSYGKQELKLADGVDIYIGTPGRIIDFMKSGRLNFNDLDLLVLDEADRMFDMGFFPDIKFIMKKLPPKDKRMTLLFSATLAYKVRNLAWEYMNYPEEIEIETENITVDQIEQKLFHTSQQEKKQLLLGILAKEKPKNVIIFANTKVMVEELSKRLEINGYKNEFIIGDLPQRKRIRIINGIKNGDINVLVATDVAARGLHVDDLDMVINYDLPEDAENYVHRIGRTARAGKSGKAYSIACEKYVYHLEAIEEYISNKIPVEWVDSEFLVNDESKGIRIETKNGNRRNSSGKPSNRRTHKQRPDNRRKGQSTERSTGQSSNNYKHKNNNRSDNSNSQYKKKKQDFKQKPAPTKKSFKTSPIKKKGIRADRNGTFEQRIAYYREKYGEEFKVSEETIRREMQKEKSKKKSFLKKIFPFFK